MAVEQSLARQENEPRGVAIADPETARSALTHYLGTGDLSRLEPEQRAALYLDTCASLNLNPRTRPFDWIEFWDPETKAKKLTLYPNRSCAEQLRRQHQMRVRVVKEEIVGALFKVVVEGTLPNGRCEEASSYVPLTDKDGNKLVGTRLANAFMKGQTSAKRRLTFAMVGMFAPPELEDLQRPRIVIVDEGGNVLDHPTLEQKALAADPGMARAIGEPTFETGGSAAASPLAGTPGQQVRPEELERPQRQPGPPPSLRASEEDVKRWCGAWFAAVKKTPWDTDEARHVYVHNHTSEWPESKRTDSLRTMFARSTEAEARDFLAGIRAVVNVWKQGQRDEATGEPEPGSDVGMTPETAAEEVVHQRKAENPSRTYEELFGEDQESEGAPMKPPAGVTPEVHAAATLTDAPAAGLERLDPTKSYARRDLLAIYGAWAAKMTSLDVMWKPDDVKRLPDEALKAAITSLTAQCHDLEAWLAQADTDGSDGADEESESATAF